MQIVLLSLLIGFLSLFADDFMCKVDDRIMYAIAKIEKHKKTPVGYPYLISINSKKDQQKIRRYKNLKRYFLDTRTLDCNSKEECVSILDELKHHGVTNVDCGAFQINYKYWSMRESDYFDVHQSYLKACEIVMSHNKRKWSWENIAKYHSKTKKYNDRYKKYLIATIEKNIERGQ